MNETVLAQMETIRRERADLFAHAYAATLAFRLKDAAGQATAMRGLTAVVNSIVERDDESGLRQVNLEEIAAGVAA